MAETSEGLLDGTRILDAGRLLPAEYATQLLADHGAEVIRIEAPGGAYGRGMPYAESLNRNKRSITLDLHAPEAQEIMRKLASTADVLFESFRPGVMKRFGLDYESLGAVNPRLVYVSLTGFGQESPYRTRAAHNINFQAIAGALGSFGTGLPQIPSVPVVDLAGAVVTAFATTLALLGARTTGRGQYVDVSMLDVAASLNVIDLALAHAGLAPDPALRDLPLGRPDFGLYETADARYIATANVEPKFWKNFVEAIGAPHLVAAHHAGGEEWRAARAEIEQIIRSEPLAHWLDLLEGLDVCVAPVNTPAEALSDRHFHERGVFNAAEDGHLDIAFPARFSAAAVRGSGEVPRPGQDNDDVLGELGLTANEIGDLRRRAII